MSLHRRSRLCGIWTRTCFVSSRSIRLPRAHGYQVHVNKDHLQHVAILFRDNGLYFAIDGAAGNHGVKFPAVGCTSPCKPRSREKMLKTNSIKPFPLTFAPLPQSTALKQLEPTFSHTSRLYLSKEMGRAVPSENLDCLFYEDFGKCVRKIQQTTKLT